MTIAELNEAEVKSLRHMLNNTYHIIGSDLFSDGRTIPQAELVEVVLDADYLEGYGPGGKPEERAGKKVLIQKFRTLPHKDQVKFAKTVFTFKRYGL